MCAARAGIREAEHDNVEGCRKKSGGLFKFNYFKFRGVVMALHQIRCIFYAKVIKIKC